MSRDDNFNNRRDVFKQYVCEWLDGLRSRDELFAEIDSAFYDVRALTLDEAHSYPDHYPKERPFLAGDGVVHLPSGEHWVLACDQEGEDVMPAGWPECSARARHCRLVRRAESHERMEMLSKVSRSRDDYNQQTRRSRVAEHQLSRLQAGTVAPAGAEPVGP